MVLVVTHQIVGWTELLQFGTLKDINLQARKLNNPVLLESSLRKVFQFIGSLVLGATRKASPEPRHSRAYDLMLPAV